MCIRDSFHAGIFPDDLFNPRGGGRRDVQGGIVRQFHAAERLPGKSFTIGTLLHPSPASPIANKLWPERPVQQLKELGIL